LLGLPAWRIQNNVKKMLDFLQGFPKICMYISTVVAVAFPLFTLTEVIWICNVAYRKEGSLWFVLLYGVATTKKTKII